MTAGATAVGGAPPILFVAVGAGVLISAFFSFSETCLTSLADGRLHALLVEKGRRGAVLRLWMERPHEVLTNILIGNNLANIAATACMTRLALALGGEAAVSWAVGIMTFLVLVFGEITPKTLARQHADRMAIPVLHVLRVVGWFLIPATWALARLARLAARLSGSDLEAGRDVTESEIRALIDLGARDGTLGATRSEYLRGVFGLSERSVREIMVARTDLVSLDLEAPVSELVKQVDASTFSRFPVHRGTIDEVVGVLHARGLLHLLATRGEELSREDVESAMIEPMFVPESLRLDKLLRQFRQHRKHLAIVLDEFGGTAGIATLEDVIEELVGEIWDEHDELEEQVLVRRGPGSWTAAGKLPLAALGDRLGLDVPKDEAFDTLAGLLMHLAGEVPAVGSSCTYGGYQFRVLSGDAKRVGLVSAEKLETDPN